MPLYLPIAEISLNLFTLLFLGGAVGVVSGLFGVGGGFLLTPLLMFVGIPAPVAVASASLPIAASAITGALSHARRNAVDFELAAVLIAGGFGGAGAGIVFFEWMRKLGHLDLIIALSYVTLLGSVGVGMLIESLRAWLSPNLAPIGVNPSPQNPLARLIRALPWQHPFKRAHVTISLLPIFVLGFAIGFIGLVLGIGGAFMLIPALIYLVRVPLGVVVGTVQVQIVLTMFATTLLQAVFSQQLDILLAFVLVVGSVIGAQLGARAARFFSGIGFRFGLALLILGVGLRFGIDLVTHPADRYSVTHIEVTR